MPVCRPAAAGIAAAPLASSLGAPLLLTPASALDAAVAADIRGRAATEVIIVGSLSVVSDAVAVAVSELGVRVTRLAGSDDAATAAAVAQRMPATRTAVAGLAVQLPRARAGRGGAGSGAPGPGALRHPQGGANRDAVCARWSNQGDCGRSPRPVEDGAQCWPRSDQVDTVVGVDLRGCIRRCCARASLQCSVVILLPSSPASWAIASAAAAHGRPLLFTDGSALSPSVASLLKARTAIRSAASPVWESALRGTVLGAASRLLVPTGPLRLSTANATPEPVRKGRTITVSAKVTAQYGDGSWRTARDGLRFSVEFKARGSSTYRTVPRGTTVAGRATSTVPATTSGRWRISVASAASGSDYVTVTR